MFRQLGRRRFTDIVADQTNQLIDVVVIGGGHAGCEAASAAARCGARTVLLTHRKDTIGEMSCNPSFGGIGKGHLVREVDALDGVCARICDKSAINYHALNTSRGAAVLGLRAQIDRSLYKQHMQHEIINNTPNLTVLEAEVNNFLIAESPDAQPYITSVVLSDGQILPTKAAIVTSGTFLGGRIYSGNRWQSAGRLGEKASNELSKTFKRFGFKLGRFRTGTPARLIKSTIDFTKFEQQNPDEKPIPFSFMTDRVWLPPDQQLPTFLGYTNRKLSEMVLKYCQGNDYIKSEANGPRYCPSLESRVIRFPNMNHRIFLENEGLKSELIYPQSMSMTFSVEAQLEIFRCLPGLENVKLHEVGYGVEYDFVDPKQLKPSLETKIINGLFLAGQINGTTGYEEAAAQGIVAGINAAALCRNDQPMIIDRTEGYIGVLIDDLTSLGTSEPYRMFTSRAEFRLHLRPDNADARLTEKGRRWRSVGDCRYKQFQKTMHDYQEVFNILSEMKYPLSKWRSMIPRLESKRSNQTFSAYDLISRFDVTFKEIEQAEPGTLKCYREDGELENRIKCEGMYSFDKKKHTARMEEVRRECATEIPDDFNYCEMKNISAECKEKFENWRPKNLAAASRVPGVTTDALIELLKFLKHPKLEVVR